MLIEALHKVKMGILLYSLAFLESIFCSSLSDLCWHNICNACKDGSLIKFEKDGQKQLNWFQWEKRPGPTGREQLLKLENIGPVNQAVEYVKKQAQSFSLRHINEQKQSQSYNPHKSFNREQEIAVLQTDFAENY